MLRACWKLLEPGGKLAFFTIFPTPGLDPTSYQRAIALGPRAVATRRREHEELVRSAGFELLRVVDLTVEFRRVARDMLALEQQYEDDLRPAVGAELFYGRLVQLEESITAIDEGLLRRALFFAERPALDS